jgi:hypothetical protein
MIYLVRTIGIQPGKWDEAFTWAVNIANWINEHYPQLSVEVLWNITGPKSRVHWVVRCESLATWEETRDKMDADPGYQDVVAGGDDLVDLTLWVDNFYGVAD